MINSRAFGKAMVVYGAAALLAAAQDPTGGDGARALWNSKFADARTQPGGESRQAPARDAEAFVGVTVWRLRSARASDPSGVRLLVHERDRQQSFTPERVDTSTPLSIGERIRIGIESARSGYLYVIDRERYGSGEVGPPYLIFPSRRIHGGEN